MNKRKYIFVLPLVLTLAVFILGFSVQDDRSQENQRSLGSSDVVLQNSNQFDGIPGVHSMTTDGHFIESFEGVTFPPAGWTKISPDGGTGWNRQTAGTTPVPGWGGGLITTPPGGETATAFCTWTTGGGVSNDQWLITPQIMSVQSDDSLKFWLRYWPNSFRDSIEVLISTATPTVGDFTTLVWRKNFAVGTLDTGWIKYGFRLGNHVSAGSNIYIAFREVVLDNFNDGASFSLDLVEVSSSTPAQLSGDYTIGVALFNTLTGKSLTFEKRTKTVSETFIMNDEYLNPETYESESHTVYYNEDGTVETRDGKDAPSYAPERVVTYTYEQEYYVPMQNGQEYTGSLYHEFTEAEKVLYNLGDGIGVYATITAAVADANTIGLSGPTRFLLLDATYPSETFPITFNNVPGTSAANTLTVLPATGVTTTIAGSPTNLTIFRVDNSDYIIFDGRQNGTSNPNSMSIENLTTTGGASHVVQYINGSTNCVIQFCNLKGNAQGTAGNRVIDISTSASNPSGNSNLRFSGNLIDGNRSVIGSSGTAANPNQNIIIENNIIQNGSFAHVWLFSNIQSVIIRGNDFTTVGPGYNVAGVALLIGTVAPATTNEVYNNKFYGIKSTVTTTGRHMTFSPSAGSIWNIYNNFFAWNEDDGTKTSVYSILASGANDYTLNLYFNTFYISGTHTGGTAGALVSAGYVKTNTNVTSVLNYKNNVSRNTRNGGPGNHLGTAFTNLAGVIDINYNTHFSNGGANSFNVSWGGTFYNVLADYQTAATPHEANSKFKQTNFVSTTDLHLIAPSVGDLDLIGTPITGITTDIDGDVREPNFPYQGADEGNIPLPVDLASFSATVNERNVTLNWTTAWEVNNERFEIHRRVNSEDAIWNIVGSVSGSGTSYQSNNYSYTDKNLVTGKYEYRLVQFDYDGNSTADFTLSQVIEIGTPSRFDLSQNYPNPFNPVTKINFEIPVEGLVKLVVYDMSGREVSSLINEVLTPGYYTADFNGEKLSSGVYFYRLVTNNNSVTKRMVLIK